LQILYVLSVWLHIMAAITWVGGMLFLVLVVVPWLRRADRVVAAGLMRDTGRRFRTVGWVCFGIVLLTGSFNLWVRGVRFHSFADAAWRASPFGHAVTLKLSVFVVVIALSAVHDFRIGPAATQAQRQAPGSPEAERLRRLASWMGRGNTVLALWLVALAVVIVRGWPW
jgi:putative copper resistance protein D